MERNHVTVTPCIEDFVIGIPPGLRDVAQNMGFTRDGHGSIFLHPTQPNPSTYGPNPTHDANTRT